MRDFRAGIETGMLACSACRRVPPRLRDAAWRESSRQTLRELAFARAFAAGHGEDPR